MVDVFSEGFAKTDEQIEQSKQAVIEEENYLVDEIPESSSLVNIAMRIPGPIKNNRYISRTFDLIVKQFVNKYKISKIVTWDLSTGPQAFIIVDKDPGLLKQECVDYEINDPLGPIADIDVFSVEEDHVSEISRKELGLNPRKCLVCDKSGKECKRNNNHTQAEINRAIDQIINDNVKF